jgi:hypothetical protein
MIKRHTVTPGFAHSFSELPVSGENGEGFLIVPR